MVSNVTSLASFHHRATAADHGQARIAADVHKAVVKTKAVLSAQRPEEATCARYLLQTDRLREAAHHHEAVLTTILLHADHQQEEIQIAILPAACHLPAAIQTMIHRLAEELHHEAIQTPVPAPDQTADAAQQLLTALHNVKPVRVQRLNPPVRNLRKALLPRQSAKQALHDN